MLSLPVNLTFWCVFWRSLVHYLVSSQNAHLLKLFSPLPTLPQFEQTFFILSNSAAAPAAFAAFFPLFPIPSPSNDAEVLCCPLFYFSHRESSVQTWITFHLKTIYYNKLAQTIYISLEIVRGRRRVTNDAI